MKEKVYRPLRNRIDKCFREWIHRLDLGWWEIEINYITNKRTIKQLFSNHKNDWSVLADVHTEYQYATASIKINTPAWLNIPDEELHKAVIHELCHILVNGMRWYDLDKNHEERVVTTLQKAFEWVTESESKVE